MIRIHGTPDSLVITSDDYSSYAASNPCGFSGTRSFETMGALKGFAIAMTKNKPDVSDTINEFLWHVDLDELLNGNEVGVITGKWSGKPVEIKQVEYGQR